MTDKKYTYLLGLQHINRTHVALVGGKAANLGELTGMAGIRVPDGFCITTQAFKDTLGGHEQLNRLLDKLADLPPDDHAGISLVSSKIRDCISNVTLPQGLAEEIEHYLRQSGGQKAYAVRSSATAEDLPTASFAGQQDTYLNIIGVDSILHHIRRCWASLFTVRAVIYRIQNGFHHRRVELSVLVQQMVFPQASGILFTADPVNGNRKVVCIDAGFGLGEALVGGRVNADHYKVQEDKITGKQIYTQKLSVEPLKAGGTTTREMTLAQQKAQVLSDAEMLSLAQLGRKIEACFGQPQDVEWCLADGEFYIVQSRPITTLFPVPQADDDQNHLYISVGHQQMMTDALKPLGLSFYLLNTLARMRTAGGRLFVDVTAMLASPGGRETLLNMMGKSDPLMKDALLTVIERGDFIPAGTTNSESQPMPVSAVKPDLSINKAVVAELILKNEAAVAALKQNIVAKSGAELFDFIREDVIQMRQMLFQPESMAAILAGMDALAWLNEKMLEWLGEKNAGDTLAQSVPNNVTSEMGLALMDLADVMRPYPEVIAFLQQTKADDFLNHLLPLKGGAEARTAIEAFLNKYGMRCAGEIDITRNRWIEQPATLIPLILGNIRNFEPGAGKRKFEQGLQEARNKEQKLLKRLKNLPDGEQKAAEAKQYIDKIRDFSGYREYPKYSIVSRYWIYKQALLNEAAQLTAAGLIQEKEDIFYLMFEELQDVVRTNQLDYAIISERKAEFKHYEKLTPPRVITSDGEIITGRYQHENLPAGAFAGLAVSAGIMEGRARVILNMADANLEPGDILITTFTDPSWTPLFVCISGLVTEVGGMMTHGSVIAREYGLPAVVGVQNATTLIKDGQMIRVNGVDGYVEVL